MQFIIFMSLKTFAKQGQIPKVNLFWDFEYYFFVRRM